MHWFNETIIHYVLVNVRTSQERFQASQNMTTFSPSSKLRLAWEQALVTSPSIRAFFHPRISFGTWVTLVEERFAGCHARGNFSWTKTKDHHPTVKFTAYIPAEEINKKEAISPIRSADFFCSSTNCKSSTLWRLNCPFWKGSVIQTDLWIVMVYHYSSGSSCETKKRLSVEDPMVWFLWRETILRRS